MKKKVKTGLIISLMIGVIFISGGVQKEITVVYASDYSKTAKDVLKEKIPEIKNYPKLEQVFVDLYSSGGFTEQEINFMKIGFDIYKEKPELRKYAKEVLYYVMSWHTEYDHFDANYFNQAIIPLAKDVTKGSENDMASVKAIQKWVNRHITYSEDAFALTLKDILEPRKGKCAHYSKLIVAMCRAIGIPARETRYVDAHGWEEVYINGDWISLASTGTLDYNKDQIIDYSDLERSGSNKMVDVFVGSPFGEGNRVDMTFGYNKYIVDQMITKAEDILKEGYNLEAENSISEAKELLSLWKKENSVEKRNIIGREAMEHALLGIAVMTKDARKKEVSVAFLEDFPLFLSKRIDFVTSCESTVKDSINESTEILYIFDAIVDMPEINIEYGGEPPFINFDAVLIARDAAKKEGFDINLVFISDATPPQIEFWNDQDIEALSNFKGIFESGKAFNFIQNFTNTIDSVQNKIVNKTTFYLPQKLEGSDYCITAIGGIEYEDTKFLGYSIHPFKLVVENRIGGLLLKKETSTRQTYTNLIIINELGEISKPEKRNGKYYYSQCPSNFVDLTAGQNLVIEREGDFVKITETGKA